MSFGWFAQNENFWSQNFGRSFLRPLSVLSLWGFSSVASRGEESEKHRLENIVWNPWVHNVHFMVYVLLTLAKRYGETCHQRSETSKRHLKRQQPQSDTKSDATFAAIVLFLTCHFTVVAFRGRCTTLQKSSFHGC